MLVQSGREAADQPLVLHQALADNEAFRRDFVFPNILAVIPAAHLDDHHNSPKLALDLDITLQNNIIAEERNRVRADQHIRKETVSTVVSTLTPAPVKATTIR